MTLLRNRLSRVRRYWATTPMRTFLSIFNQVLVQVLPVVSSINEKHKRICMKKTLIDISPEFFSIFKKLCIAFDESISPYDGTIIHLRMLHL
jgi:hypothetical protein